MRRLHLLLSLLALSFLLTGCGGPERPPIERVDLVPSEALAPAPRSLSPEELVERIERGVVYIEVAPRGVKHLGEYAHAVGTSFTGMLASPVLAPVWLYQLTFGWLDFSTVYGSGFVVTARGHVVTNAHVVGDAEVVRIARPDGVQSRARVVAVDKGRDLALLRIELAPGEHLPPEDVVPLGRSSELRLGQRILVYGFPGRPWSQSCPKPTVTLGIVSALGIDVGEDAPRIQVDAAVNPGNSGGPVVDVHGRVVGVVTEAADPGRFENEAFAIPIDDVEKALFRQENDAAEPGARDAHPRGKD